MKTYEKYKPSGIEWIGDIPENWSIERAKWLFTEAKVRNRDLEFTELDLLSVSEYYGVAKRAEKITSSEVLNRAESLAENMKVSVGSLVINIMLAWKKGLGVSNDKGIVSPSYCVFDLNDKNHNPRYFHHLFRTDLYADIFRCNSTGIIDSRLRLYPDEFGNILILIPPIAEQTTIADYLDKKTAEIDKLTANKRRLIELLKEERTAIINTAVTRGINADAKLKPSGIDWLGDIPEHWEVKKLKYLGSFQNGISEGADYFGSGFPFVSYGDVYKNTVLPFKVDGLANSTISDRRRFSVNKGDVFFTRTSETIEEIGIASTCLKKIENAIFSGFLIRFRPDKDIFQMDFAKYYFRSQIQRVFFVKEMNLVTRASLSQDLLKRLPVLLPNIKEQKEIADFLDDKTNEIDSTISKIEKEIELIKEYRTALISEVVTGKIKVM